MAELTVANYLAALQDDPWDQSAMEGLQAALASGDPKRTGDDPVRLLEFARRNHELRGEHLAAAKLIELELGLVTSDPDFAAVLWRELARVRRDELMDDAGAREAYEHVVRLRPGDEDVRRALAQIEQVGTRWQEISRRFIDEAAQASDPTLRTSLLVRAASILWQYKKKGRNKEVDRLFEEALQTDPSSARAARLFELTLRDRGKWVELAEVLLGVAQTTESKDDRLGLLLGAARITAQRLRDPERAASCYEKVLELAPAHEEALGYLVAHFTERKEWEHLVALYEDALRARQLKLEAEQGIVLQIAMVHWRMLDRADRAEPYFARVRKSDPAQPVMLDYYRERYTASGESGKLLAVLSDAQRRVESDEEKSRFALEIARLARADASSIERAIDAYKLVLRSEPQHVEARSMLKELYRRSGKWNALVDLLRSELDALAPEESQARLALLKEMLVIYRDELKLEATVLSTYNTILQIDPGDKEATAELARTYEQMGRWNDLIPVLMREAESEQEPARKVELLSRVARLWIEHFSNYNQATHPLEQILAIDPGHREALARLREIYTKKRAWQKLGEVLQREEALTQDPAQKRALLVELAGIVGERLHDYPQAIALYRRMLVLDPRTPGALDQLEKLAERAKDWSTLAEVLEQRASEQTDVALKTKLLIRIGTLHTERTQNPALAASAWKRVLELDPKNGRALRTLREAYLAAGDYASIEALYAEHGDWEGFVDVLGSAADRSTDPEQKRWLSFRAAEVYEQKLKEPARAFRSYERVLAVDPENERAVRALLPIYERDDKWPRVAQLTEILLGTLPEEALEQKLELLLRLVEIQQVKLRDGERAFLHAERAYGLAPDDPRTSAKLESAAELASAHERLVSLYSARAEQTRGEGSIQLRRKVAQLLAERLKRPELAARQLEAILDQEPGDQAAQSALERIYRSTGRAQELAALYTRTLEHVVDEEQRIELLRARARVEEESLADLDAAVSSYRALYALRPQDRGVLATLDRLLSIRGPESELIPVVEAQVALAEEKRERIELLLRLGRLAEGEPGALERSIRAPARVLEIEPSEARAVEQLEQIAARHPAEATRIALLLEPVYERTGRLDKLVALQKRRLELSTDPQERRTLKLRLAEIEGMLGDPKSAYATLESAFLDNPQNPELWERMTHIAEQANALDELAVAFSTAIEMAALTEDESAALSARTARLYDDVLGQPERAEPFYRRVLAADPGSEQAYEGLRELYTTRERWDDLKALYRERIEHVSDPQQRLELLLQVCFLYEEILDDVERAIAAYEAVLELDPWHSTSRRALERLYTRADRLADLVRLLETERDRSEGKEAVELTYRIGSLYESRLGSPERAVDQYAAVLEAQRTHARAQEALARLLAEPSQRQRVAALLEPVYAEQGAHLALAQVLEVQLEQLTDVAPRRAVLLRLGELRERELADVQGAFEAYGRAVEADPGDERARIEFARVASLAEQVRERAALLERVLVAQTETRSRIEILSELAETYDYALADRERAIEAYTRLVQVDPHDGDVVLPAARALERLHTEQGDDARLAEALRLQISFEREPGDKALLLGRLAELSERSLGDLPRAIEAYGERLEIDPADLTALLALERLYRAQRDYPRLIEILQRRDALSGDPEEARRLARAVGEIYERELGDRARAVQAYEDVASRFGPDRETLGALARVYESAGQYRELLEVVLHELEHVDSAEERADVRFRAAELMRRHTGAPEAALDAYGVVLSEHPGHPGALGALTEMMRGAGGLRVEAARVLAPHFAGEGASEALIESLEVLAESEDPRERIDALARASEVAEQRGELERAYRLLSRAVQAALYEHDLGSLLDELERLARAAESYPTYVALLQEIAPSIADEELSLRVMMRAALVARDELRDPAEARGYFERALAIRPDHGPALDALEALHEQAGDDRGLLQVLIQKTELAVDFEQRAALLVRQAELSAQRLGDLPRAIAAYERLLDESPSESAFVGLERLYERAERYPDLVSLYERQLDLQLGDAVAVRFRLAELLRHRRGDVDLALELYREVLAESPLHEGARLALEALFHEGPYRARAAELLEPLYLRSERWPDLARALEAQLAAEEGSAHAKELLGRLAQLYEVQLEDLEAALEIYARLFRADPSDEHALEALARMTRNLGKEVRLAEIIEGHLEDVSVHDELTVRLAVLAAQLRDQHGGDLERATRLYERALAFDPASRTLADGLEDLLLRRQAHDELRAFYRAQADVSVDLTHRLALLRKLAVILELELRDVDGAIRTHQEVIELSPRDSESTAALDRLLAEAKRWTELAEHLRHQIDELLGTDLEIELKLRLARLYEEKLEDIELAIDTYAEVVELAPDHVEARRALERLAARPELLARVAEILRPLYEATGAWEKQVWLLETLVAAESDPAERAELYRQTARLCEREGRSPQAAMLALRRALVSEPGDADTRAELARLATELDDWSGYVDALEEAAQATSESALKASLLASVARTHDEKRGDPRSAIHAYERLVQCDTDDAAAFDELEALLMMVGDWDGVVALFRRKIERSYDPAERAALWRRSGSVLDELIGDTPLAIEAYAAALEEIDDDLASLTALDDLYGRVEDHAALAEVLRRRAELLENPDERIDAHLRLGRVLAERLGRTRKAVDAFTRVLDDDPNQLEALVALGKLYAAESMWPELLENLRRQLELVSEPRARLALLYTLGQVHDEHLSEFDDAIDSYSEALAIDPSHDPSIRALMRIGEQAAYRSRVEEILEPSLREQGRWDDLATVLSRGISGIPDPSDRQQRLVQLARIHEQGRGDLAAAFDAVCEALVQDADEPALADDLERLAGTLSMWDRAADVLSHRAAKTGDAETARELYRRVARITERELHDVPRTIQTYEVALARGGEDGQLLLELDRLYSATERFEELADVLERRVSYASEAEAAQLLLRLGELRESRFGDAQAALNAYRDVLDREPSQPMAIQNLERLLADRALMPEVVELLESAYRSSGDLERVAALYEARLPLADSAADRGRLLSDLAALYENELGQPSRAAETLRRAFQADPSDFGLLDEIERVAHTAGRFELLEGLIETAVRSEDLPRTDRRDLWMRAAAWYRERLSNLPRAELALREAIELDPEYEPAHEARVSLLRSENRQRDLVDALFAWASREPDRVVAVERYTEGALIAETAASQPERAIEGYEQVLALDPSQVQALDALIRMYEASGKLGKVAQLYDRRIEAESDGDTRANLRHRAAKLRAERLEDFDGAIRLELANLDEDPADLAALTALERLYEQTERYRELARVLERRVDVADSVESRTRARLRLALISEQQLGDRERAIRELREVALETPSFRDAHLALERLLESEGRYPELVEQLERRSEFARDAGDTATELALLVRLAQLLEQRLGERTRAVEQYERVLERDPGHVGAMTALARLYAAEGEPVRAAELLEALLSSVQGEELAQVSFRLAEIAEGELREPGRAELALRRALEVPSAQRETRDRLRALYERSSAYAELAALLEDEADLTQDSAQQVTYLRQSAELYRDQLDEPARAAVLLERASQLAPDDRALLIPLCELYMRSSRQADAIPVLQKIIASYGTRRVKELAGYHRWLARALREVGDSERAMAELEAAYRIDLTNVGVLADLALLAYERADFDRAQKTFRGLLLQKLDRDAPLSKADVYFYLGDISQQQGDRVKAVSMLERALAEQPRHERARTLLASLKG